MARLAGTPDAGGSLHGTMLRGQAAGERPQAQPGRFQRGAGGSQVPRSHPGRQVGAGRTGRGGGRAEGLLTCP